MTENSLDHEANAVKSATSLRELHQALIAFEDALDTLDEDECAYSGAEYELESRGVDICNLPTFGGEAPSSTTEVWAWDTDRLLVGVGPFREWNIIDRQDWEKATLRWQGEAS